MTRAELRWALRWALAVMLITCLPYLYVARFAPPGTSFSGLLNMGEDHCVYLAWEQQAAQGHFLLRNLFTADPQRGIYIHLLSWLIGTAARFTCLPLVLVHHGARLLAGMVLLVLVYALSARFTTDVTTRRAAFWFTALSAGFGAFLLRPGMKEMECSVDLWQPEAITFLCLHGNGLFCVALAAMVGIFLLLLAADERQGGARWRRVVGAGLLALLLGNIHSYDIITVAAVWAIYVVARALTAGARGQGTRVTAPDHVGPRPLTPHPQPFAAGRSLTNALVAGIVALPATAYQYYLYRTEPVFRMRADSATATPSLLYYLEGYGLVFLLAIVGLVWLACMARRRAEPLGEQLLPMIWSLVGFALPYLPFSFQRKLAMGLHLPLAFLAAVGAVAFGRWVTTRTSGVGQTGSQPGVGHAQSLPGTNPRRANSLPPSRLATAIVAGLLLFTVPTNIHCMRWEIDLALDPHLEPGQLPIFLGNADTAALRWVKRSLPHEGAILCTPPGGLLIPALAGRTVYAGHWSETPQGEKRMLESMAFYQETSAVKRRAFLAQHGIRFVYVGPSERQFGAPDFSRDPDFHQIYARDGAAVYEVQPPITTATTLGGKAIGS